jgi:hypothetical protein
VFLRLAASAEIRRVHLTSHFERLRISDGRMHLSSRPGLGITSVTYSH